MNNSTIKPFVKWAGGKGQILSDIQKTYPNGLGKTIRRYCEPFVGGGAVLFDVLSRNELDEVFINDINAELINTYRMVKEDAEALIKALANIESEYIPLSLEDRKQYYYAIREQYNDEKVKGDRFINLKKATLFIFLNRTCFNGLYRVNSTGLYNVPMGAYKSPTICDADNLRNVSAVLKNVDISCGDYQESEKFIDSNTFVYLDPPYRPLTETANFTSYTEMMFDDRAQIELAAFIDRISVAGARAVLSNSDPKNIDGNDNFFDELYRNHSIKRITAKRMINRNGESRGAISELLICNY
jgi:DNA adenine methylase